VVMQNDHGQIAKGLMYEQVFMILSGYSSLLN